jgi:glycosyltransferase involved in cell wall biosynthesis
MKLVASMITRNEMGRYLPLAVAHLVTYVDEIRVLDDGSTDGSYEWLQRVDKVEVLRNPGPTFFEYESKARQALLEWTMKGQPTHVLSIDADEFVGSPDVVRRVLQTNFPVYTLSMEEVWACSEHELCLRVDGLWGPRKCPIVWKAPQRLEGVDWVIPDRKLACGREPLAVRRQKAQVSRSSVYHFGWTRRSERQARAERYFEHDQGKFHADRHLQSILNPDDKVVMASAEWPAGLENIRPELARLAQ